MIEAGELESIVASGSKKGGNTQEYAIKVFKTSILKFKDRDRYV